MVGFVRLVYHSIALTNADVLSIESVHTSVKLESKSKNILFKMFVKILSAKCKPSRAESREWCDISPHILKNAWPEHTV